MSELSKSITTWDQMKHLLGLDTNVKKPKKASITAKPKGHSTVALRAGGAAAALMRVACKDGERTHHLVRLAGALFEEGFNLVGCIAQCKDWNSRNIELLDEGKIEATCASIWQADLRNHPERHQTGPSGDPLFDIADAKIDTYLSTTPPPQRWVLNDFLPLGIAATLVSQGGTGKSQIMMQLAVSVATGIPLCGNWSVGEEGSVLMLCAEDSEAEIHRRIHRIQQQLGLGQKSPLAAKLTSRFFIKSVTGEDMLMTKLVGTGRELTRTAIANRLSLTAKQLDDLKLIILDPASRFRGGDENSNDHGTRFVEALEFLAKETGATVLVAHHAGKGAAKGGASQDNSRGASSLTDGVRWQMVLTSITPNHRDYKIAQLAGPGHYVEAALVKTNYTAPKDAVLLRREQDGYLQVVTLPPVAAKGQTSDAAMVQLLNVIETSQQPLSGKQVEAKFCGKGKQIDIGQRAVRPLLQRARDEGLIRGEGLLPLKLTKEGKMFLGEASRMAQNAQS